MDISIKPGKYVVAVSGGVDSVVLLHVLMAMPGLDLVVAHFEHGIRPDADHDRIFVAQLAQEYGLPFVYEHGHLGQNSSEAAAREARYAFLYQVCRQTGARAIITAHHQDDLIETAMINLLRGTGRKGLSSLRSTQTLLRPFLHISKQAIVKYAQTYGLIWAEDSTNFSDDYLRNYLRHHIVARMTAAQRETFLRHIIQAQTMNETIDMLLLNQFDNTSLPLLNRRQFSKLPHAVAREVMAAWLRKNGLRQFDRRVIERLVVHAKVAFPGKKADIIAGYQLKTDKVTIQIIGGTLSSN